MTGKQTGSSADLHGEIVAWDTPRGGGGIRLIREALHKSGLPTDVAPDLTWKAAFSRGVQDMKKDRLIEKVVDKDGVIRFQFTAEARNDERINHIYECSVSMDKETGSICCVESPEIEDDVRTRMKAAYIWRNSADITRMVHALFRANADLFPLNRKGVAYFVPVQHQGFVEKVAEFFEAFGGVFERFPVPKGRAAGDKSVQATVLAGLSSLISEAEESMSEFDETTRRGSSDKLVSQMEVIEYKIKAYSHMLGEAQGKLTGKLQDAKDRFARKIVEIERAKAAASS